MEFRFTDDQEAFRLEVREFFRSELGEGRGGIDPDTYFRYDNWRLMRGLTEKLVQKNWLTLARQTSEGGRITPLIERRGSLAEVETPGRPTDLPKRGFGIFLNVIEIWSIR